LNSLRLLTAALLVAAVTGCGAPKPAAPAGTDTTSAVPAAAACSSCTGSDSTGAVCETLVDTAAAAAQVTPAAKPAPAVAAAGALPGLWDFGSSTCIPCRTMKTILEPMTGDYQGKVDIRIIDVYQEKELARRFGITVIPTQVFLDAQGKELRRHLGVYPRDSIEACFREFGFPVVTGAKSPTPSPAFGST
jgi:thioredoxin 1